MKTGKLIVVVGLPGAGKSTRIQAMRPSISGLCCEDFHALAIDGSPLVEHSRHYGTLLKDLREGRDCVVGDIAFCDPSRSADLERSVRGQITGVKMSWIYFENAPEKCRRNILDRGRESVGDDLVALDKFSKVYCIPPGITPLPVWEKSQ